MTERKKCALVECDNYAGLISRPGMTSGAYCRKHFYEIYHGEIKRLPSEMIALEMEFEVVIEQDEDGIYIASVPDLEGCHTQAGTLNDLRDRMTEAVELYLRNVDGRLTSFMKYKKE